MENGKEVIDSKGKTMRSRPEKAKVSRLAIVASQVRLLVDCGQSTHAFKISMVS